MTSAPFARSQVIVDAQPPAAAAIAGVKPPSIFASTVTPRAARRLDHAVVTLEAATIRLDVELPLGPRLQQQFDDLVVAVRRGINERRLAARLGRVELGTFRDQRLDRRGMAVDRGRHQRPCAPRRP